MAITSTTAVHVYELPAAEEKEKPAASGLADLKEVKTISRDAVTVQAKLSFRAARFGRGPTASQLLTVLNAPLPSKKGGPRKTVAAAFDVGGPWALARTRVLANKPVTTVDLSACGTRLAYGCSDLSVGIVDATTFGVRPSSATHLGLARACEADLRLPFVLASPCSGSCARTSSRRPRSSSTRPAACCARPASTTRSASTSSLQRSMRVSARLPSRPHLCLSQGPPLTHPLLRPLSPPAYVTPVALLLLTLFIVFLASLYQLRQQGLL